MISHHSRAIFVHVPKVGGQSVAQVFLDRQGLSWDERGTLLMKYNSDPALGPSRLAHLKAREYVELGHLDAQTYADYYKFAFVRNPWDRLVSEYRYRRSAQVRPFDEFVRHEFANIDDYTDQSRHIIPQTDYLVDGEGRTIVDFVGRFETLADDFRTVARALALEVETLPKRNVSGVSKLRRLFGAKPPEKRPYQEYYSDALRDEVGDYYRRDIETFGYSFDGAFSREPIIQETRA